MYNILFAAKNKLEVLNRNSPVFQMIYLKNYKFGVLFALFLLCFWITVQLCNIWFGIVNKSTMTVPTAKIFITQLRNKTGYLEEMDILNKQKVDMDDPRLINLIRNYWIENPSEKPYNLKKPHVIDPSIGQAAFVDNRLNFKVRIHCDPIILLFVLNVYGSISYLYKFS